MKKWSILIFISILLLLSGCRLSAFGGQVVIDWIDFIHIDGKEYYGIHSGVLADISFVGEKIGTVKFKVTDNVKNPSYKIKTGMLPSMRRELRFFRLRIIRI